MDHLLEHPSISRIHSVIVFGTPPTDAPAVGLPPVAAYIYDQSTHGTFVNKKRCKSRQYTPLRVGDNAACKDIDECADGNGGCDLDAYCHNTDGSFSCEYCKGRRCCAGGKRATVAPAFFGTGEAASSQMVDRIPYDFRQ